MNDLTSQLNCVEKKIKDLEKEYLDSLSEKSVTSEAKIIPTMIVV